MQQLEGETHERCDVAAHRRGGTPHHAEPIHFGESRWKLLLEREEFILDRRAIELWLSARCDADAREASRPNHTARIYRREAERFLLWLAMRGASLKTATLHDCLDYRTFLADPQPAAVWCGPRGAARWSAQWRPFEGPLGPAARRQAVTILRSMFAFLQDQRYVGGNAWSGVRKPRADTLSFDMRRGFSERQWREVLDQLMKLEDAPVQRQLAWLVRFLYHTGLRLSEAVRMNCDDFVWVDVGREGGCDDARSNADQGGWVVNVIGKGHKAREVPVPVGLVEGLSELLAGRGHTPELHKNPGRPVLVRFGRGGGLQSGQGEGARLSGHSLYRQLKKLFTGIAMRARANGRDEDTRIFEAASTHWLRHTCGSHSAAAGVPLDVIREGLGHASIGTTSIYLRAEIGRRIRESRRLVSSGSGGIG